MMRKKLSLKMALILGVCALFSACAQMGGFSPAGMNFSQVQKYWEVGQKVYKAASPLSAEQEYYLGRGVSARILAKYKPYWNNSVNSYVNRVGATVVASSDRPDIFGGYHFLVLDTAEVNAFASPGGFIFITKGLLKLMPNEESLAGVLAHEVGHVVLEHGVKAIKQANLTEATALLGKEYAKSEMGGTAAQVLEIADAFGKSLDNIVETLLEKGYSRSQEYDADQYAADLLKRAGYNNRGLIVMLEKLEVAESGKDGILSGFASTHPSAKDRKSEIDEAVAKAPESSPGEIVRTKRFKAAMQSLA